MRGQPFDLLAVRNNWGGDRVSYAGPDGRLCTLPVEWTDVLEPDFVVTVGAGRAVFRTDRLRELRRLIGERSQRQEAGSC
ncbi:MAG: transposase [Gammaproteobacteria bacterium]|nr:transposase [Gammaproteobacteria bacterium]